MYQFFSKFVSEVLVLSSFPRSLLFFFFFWLSIQTFLDFLSVLYSPVPSHPPIDTAGDSVCGGGVFCTIMLIPDANSQEKNRIPHFAKAFPDFVSIKSVSPSPGLLCLYADPNSPPGIRGSRLQQIPSSNPSGSKCSPHRPLLCMDS